MMEAKVQGYQYYEGLRAQIPTSAKPSANNAAFPPQGNAEGRELAFFEQVFWKVIPKL